ncbi:hypothetical protein [Paracoccus sp. (in: a-proteobacteria)]|uniref:hypothetical protein n=1 Tax=Paracoccus sp. TaxID=267 RepID=UPI00272DAFBC|nr:hypothetical protein [Paracoccus sp. (in: a-proteobacteria)]
MKEKHNILNGEGRGQVYLDRLAGLAAKQPDNRMAVEAARLRQMQAAATPPEVCGPAIPASPARGGFVLVQNVELLPVGDKVQAVHRGYGGREAIRPADAFDAMLAAAARAKRPAPLSPDQVAIGRWYRDLVELLSADGMKLSSLQASHGGPDGRDWMDRRLALSGRVDVLRKRIGGGIAMAVRRVRPSARGSQGACIITDRALVDAVCLHGKSIKAVLKAHGWSDYGGHQKALAEALSAALSRMVGYRS